MMDTATIMDAFGGRKEIQTLLGVSRAAPINWLRDGIPYRHWPALRRLAADRGIPNINDDTLRASRPAKGRDA